MRGGPGSQEEILAADSLQALTGKSVQRDGYDYPAVLYDGEWVPEAYLHDARVLPHQVAGGFEQLFPRVTACDELPETAESNDWLEQRGLAEVAADYYCGAGNPPLLARTAGLERTDGTCEARRAASERPSAAFEAELRSPDLAPRRSVELSASIPLAQAC